MYLISMIFRTITDDITGANKSIGLFGLSLQNISNKLNEIRTKDLKYVLFNTSDIDVNVIHKYNDAILAGRTAQDALESASKGTNDATIALMKSANGATVSEERLIAAQKASTVAAKAQSAALKAVSIAANIIAIWAITKGIELATKAIDNYVHRVEIAREKLEETTSEIESLKSELDGVGKKIDEILAKDEISLTDENTLKELQAENNELERRLKLLEAQKELDVNDLNRKIEAKYAKEWGNGRRGITPLNLTDVEKERYNDEINIDVSHGYAIQTVSRDVYAQIQIERAKELLALNRDLTDEEKAQYEEIKKYATQEGQALADLTDEYTAITDAEKEQKKIWEGLIEDFSVISSSIPGITISIDDRLKAKFAMGKEDSQVISDWIDSLNESEQKVLIGCELDEASLEDLKEYLESKVVQIEDDVEQISFFDQLNNSKDSLDKFQSSVKSAYDAYATLLSGNYSSNELLDSIQAINQAMSDIGSEIQWESMFGGGIGIAQVQEVLEREFQKYAESILRDVGIEIGSDFGQMLAHNIVNAQKTSTQLEVLNDQIDSLQSAYSDLTDIVESYNETGYITFDQLQKLLEMEPQYLACLIDENGQLQLNEAAMTELANQRLNDAEAQAIQQAITELGTLTLQDEKTAVEQNAEAFSDAINDLADYNEELSNTIAEASVGAAVIRDLNAAIRGAEENGATDDQINTVLTNLETKLKLIQNVRDQTNKGLSGLGSVMKSGSSKSSSSSSTKSEFEETIDYFERRVDVLSDALSLLETNLDNVTGAFAKNNLIDAELGLTEEKFKNYSDALNMYTQKANEALSKLPSDIAQQVRNGAVALTDFIGDGNKDVVDAIKDYESWADKIADCQQELAELKTAIRQLELEKFNNIIEDFTNQFNLRENGKDLISKQIDLLKEAGELIGESFFTEQIDQSKKQLALLEEEKAQLVNQMSSTLNSGRIQSGTDEWLEMVNALSDVEGSILDCKKAIESFDNQLLQLHTEIFERIQEQFSNLDSEISNIIGLFEDFDVANDKGVWSWEGLAQLGLLTQQYELAQYQIQQYNNEINELNRLYLEGRYSAVEYADRLAELSSAQWDAVNASEAAKDAIMDLNEARINLQIEGIEKEIDAYKELTDAQIKALKAEKDLHDYEKSIAEKSKSIADLEKQIAAMQNDNTASTIAKRKQLEKQLTDKLEELQEEQYQHSIEVQEDALNEQYENYEKERNAEIEALQESLKNQEMMIAESFEAVKNNADIIGQEIANIALEHGITVSDALISSWQSGEKAIASYGEVLSQKTSAFIGNIMQVENETWNLQAQANVTADTLAYMFSTRADNLINELAQSYYAEGNLNAMTQALHDSLVNTLEGGYDISNITSALSSIADGANSVATAANKASQALANMGALDSESTVTTTATSGSGGGMFHDFLRNRNLVREKSFTNFYASGVRHLPNDEIAITQEDGTEIILSPVRGGMLLPKETFLNKEGAVTDLRKGDTVLTAEQSDNMFKWAQFNPDEFMRGLNIAHNIPKIEQKQAPSIQIDNILTVQGSIDNGNVKRMEQVAQRAINDAFDRFSNEVKY